MTRHTEKHDLLLIARDIGQEPLAVISTAIV